MWRNEQYANRPAFSIHDVFTPAEFAGNGSDSVRFAFDDSVAGIQVQLAGYSSIFQGEIDDYARNIRRLRNAVS